MHAIVMSQQKYASLRSMILFLADEIELNQGESVHTHTHAHNQVTRKHALQTQMNNHFVNTAFQILNRSLCE